MHCVIARVYPLYYAHHRPLVLSSSTLSNHIQRKRFSAGWFYYSIVLSAASLFSLSLFYRFISHMYSLSFILVIRPSIYANAIAASRALMTSTFRARVGAKTYSTGHVARKKKDEECTKEMHICATFRTAVRARAYVDELLSSRARASRQRDFVSRVNCWETWERMSANVQTQTPSYLNSL